MVAAIAVRLIQDRLGRTDLATTRVHIWHAEGVQLIQEQDPDPGEAIEVHLMSIDEIKKAIADGRFLNAIALTAVARAYPIWDYERS